MKKTNKKVYGTISSRIDPRIQKAVKEYCARNNLKIQGFIEGALLRELEHRRKG